MLAENWKYGDSDDPVEKHLIYNQKYTIQALSSLAANRKCNRAMFEGMKTRIIALSASELDTLKCMKMAEMETVRAKLITVSEITCLEAEIWVLMEANAAAQDMVKEVHSLKDRVQEAMILEKANEGLAQMILALKRELADSEAVVNNLHDGILTVASNHSKKACRSVG